MTTKTYFVRWDLEKSLTSRRRKVCQRHLIVLDSFGNLSSKMGSYCGLSAVCPLEFMLDLTPL